MELLQITDDNVLDLLASFDREVIKGKIVHSKTGHQETCRYTGVPLTLKNFGGILPGSEIFISDTDTAYAGYALEFMSEDNED